jgi:hypothetical protein
MIERGIVKSISPRHVRRLLEEAQLKPHQIRYWLTPPLMNTLMRKSIDLLQKSNFATQNQYFQALFWHLCKRSNDIIQVYLTATERAKRGERTLCTNEMTGIQAIERSRPRLASKIW